MPDQSYFDDDTFLSTSSAVVFEKKKTKNGGKIMRKKLLPAILIGSLIMSVNIPAVAETSYLSNIGNRSGNVIKIFVNDLPLECDQPPVIVNNRTLVPLRAIFESLGAIVEWDNESRSINACKDGTSIFLKIDNNILYRNGEPIQIDVPAQIIQNRAMVPLRAISESLDSEVYWDDVSRIICVYDNDYGRPSEPEEPIEPEYPTDNPPEEPIEPEYPTVNPPEKDTTYSIALMQLRNGYSYEAYYMFKNLGDYRDSKLYLQQAYWLNQLCYNVSRLEYQEMYDIRADYELMAEYEIESLMPTTIWLMPSMQSLGGNYMQFKADGTGVKLHDLLPNQFIWTVDKGGVFLVTTYTTDIFGNTHYTNQSLQTDGEAHEFRRIVDGVYADINLIAHGVSGPGLCNTSQFFVDQNSIIGQGLEAHWNRVLNEFSSGPYIKDENGLFYEAKS